MRAGHMIARIVPGTQLFRSGSPGPYRLFGEPGIGKSFARAADVEAYRRSKPLEPVLLRRARRTWRTYLSVGIMVALLVLLLAVGVAHATVDTQGLSPAQVAELEAQAAQLKADNANGGALSTAQKVNEWVQVGQGVGAGLASAARELGIVANEFAQTPVGQITIALIIFKVAGGDLIQLLCGFLWFTTLGSIWFYFYKKLWDPIETKTNYDPTSGKKTSIERRYASLSDDPVAAYRLVGVAILGVGAVVGLFIIFA